VAHEKIIDGKDGGKKSNTTALSKGEKDLPAGREGRGERRAIKKAI